MTPSWQEEIVSEDSCEDDHTYTNITDKLTTGSNEGDSLKEIEESDLVYLLVLACRYSQTFHIAFGGTSLS